MQRAARDWALALSAAALLAGACATAGSDADREPAPAFTRVWSPYTPEQLSRDVVTCAEEARARLVAELGAEPPGPAELRRGLHERTAACMQQRGWRRL